MSATDFGERIRKLSPAKLVLLAERLQARVTALETAAREPIAIVGIGCRFPGGVDGPESYWRLLCDGVDAIREVPQSRWDVDALYDPDPDAPGKMSTRFGGFLDDVDLFDPQFFGIAPREAGSMDPQQRLLLEVTWEALEHAGIPGDGLSGSLTGVFVGLSGSDYFGLQMQGGLASIDTYLASGTAHSIASGRLAYVLGAQGPTFSVDTACSSSLVAIQAAVQSLRSGECTMALAGGVNLILSPIATVALSKAHMMAPDGRCKAFDSRANGFVRSEGAAMLVLKRLSDAVAARDDIVAVIRGVAINQDGRSNGLTAPNGPAQEAVIRAALTNGGLSPAEVGYVESHGTGTSLGDPIEVQALGAVFGRDRDPASPLYIGSVKTNIGHLESAAGIAGLIKAALVVQRGQIPPHRHLEKLNPFIPWDELPVRVPTSLTTWGEPGRRLAGVSSFGFSGTNGHVVVGEAPASTPPAASVERPLHVLALSARSDAALAALAVRAKGNLQANDARFADLCHTFGAGRAQFTHRLTVVAGSAREAEAELASFIEGGAGPRTAVGHLESPRPPRIVFLFTGQGAQYAGMGRRLYDTAPVFREALDQCAAVLREHLDRPLLSVVFAETEDDARLLSQTRYTQPATFAIQYALAALWRSWGVVPSAVMGHSVGEYAAACIAGACSLEDGLRLIATRGRLMQALPAGAMTAVFADPARVARALPPDVEIAALNGPDSVVISGPSGSVAAAAAALAAEGVQTKPLDVSHAFHSAMMEPMLDEFARVASGIAFKRPEMTLIGNVSGRAVGPDELSDAGYFRAHVRKPVQFAAGMQTLRELGHELFVEIGPSPVLVGMASRWLAEPALAWLPSLRRDRDDWEQILTTLSALYVKGIPVDWRGWDAPYDRRRLHLSTYPFQRTRYWTPGAFSDAQRGTAEAGASHAGPVPPKDDRVGRTLFEVHWDAAPLSLASGQGTAAGTFASGDAVAREVGGAIGATYARYGLPSFERFLPKLDALCGAYVVEALSRLGWSFHAGQRFTPGAVAERCKIPERHGRLLGRMLEMLTEDGWLRRMDDGWVVERAPVTVDTVAVARALREEFPEASAELTMTCRCGEHLADALSGAVDPLQLLFPGGSLADAEKLYQHSPVAKTFNSVVEQALKAALATVPQDRALRVLEIGAGTGGTTSVVLPHLPPDRTEYHFTDASRLFSGAAAEKFSAYPFLKFGKLDITADPREQGFQAGSFDLVLAANVLHATPDLRRTLSHARSLLAPGGVLLVLEAGTKERYADLTVGLTDGWWAFTDAELRPDHALLSTPQWRALLPECGFEDVTTLPGDAATGVMRRQTVIVATATRTAPAAAAGRVWALFADGADANAVANALAANGDRVTVVRPGSTFERADDGSYVIDPADGAHYARVLDEALPAERGVPATAVHLWSLGAELPEALTPSSLESSQRLASGSVMRLVQTLVTRSRGAVPLVIVTRGGQVTGAADGARAAVAQSTVWGLSHTTAIEHPELHCRRIDLDPAESLSNQAARLVEELCAGGVEDQIALRGSTRHVRRLRWSGLARKGEPIRFRSDATYLITGGLHGLGPVIARWMAERGARHLVLLGRRGPTDASRPALDELRAMGVDVHAVSADVGDYAALAAAFARLDALPPLRGVVHSAGTVRDAVLAQQTWAHFETVMAAKVRGSVNLYELVKGRELDFFALFSSGVSLLGSGGQGNHAAANAFVDVFAPWLAARGVPAVAINWGAWAEVGAAVGRKLSDDHKGVRRMAPADGLEAFERILRPLLGGAGAPSQVAVLSADWPEFFEQFGDAAEPPLYREIAREERRRAPASERAPGPAPRRFAEVLADTPPARRLALLRTHVQKLTAKVLGVPDPAAIQLQHPLHDFGLDSLMSIQLRNLLSTSLDRALPATLLFEFPTVATLTDYLLRDDSVAAAPAPAAAVTAPEPAPLAEDATEDDLAAALAARLDQIGDRLS